ncbi:MAG TPA: response regulator [Terriglobales bacterium]|nr:response regulator [Terriglobales bacterium]
MSTASQQVLPILVIEDEASVMGFLVAALERAGYRTAQAASGADALRMLAVASYLGVVSDMRTPGGVNGADVHAWLAANRPELVSRVVFITGDTVNEETQQILRHTGAPCIEKPFRVQQLIQCVEKTIGKAR